MLSILVVDDNKQITRVLETYAKNEGMKVSIAYDGQSAWELFQTNDFDIALLDVMMPNIDGITLLKMIRKSSNMPVIMITAKGEDYDKIHGLDIGADDYIVKPFSPKEVMARIRSLLRRMNFDKEEDNQDKIIKGDLIVDHSSYKSWVKDIDLKLARKEFELLWMLVNSEGQVFTRDQIIENIWSLGYDGNTRTVDTHVKKLRRKFEETGFNDYCITTIKGLGYKFERGYNEK